MSPNSVLFGEFVYEKFNFYAYDIETKKTFKEILDKDVNPT